MLLLTMLCRTNRNIRANLLGAPRRRPDHRISTIRTTLKSEAELFRNSIHASHDLAVNGQMICVSRGTHSQRPGAASELSRNFVQTSSSLASSFLVFTQGVRRQDSYTTTAKFLFAGRSAQCLQLDSTEDSTDYERVRHLVFRALAQKALLHCAYFRTYTRGSADLRQRSAETTV